ncbi:putative Aspartic-type endopeptidase [Taphrina deformans PYCC 5710]|uniref:Aspartic-type endopeptidase n=1 Tax=Taphrina deformans (strain PYCC 5710 / ATCC 11124 / CBS 356.35 / IMI 108563 / JCM 9778 / NBRC 8474) TaxID=1097556 RepID=R4X7E2_TAPDE|nr:putative Aspartic-type endopeptidase [Taphrina deformans PYCC 5710]|eukprot:CCG81285.1 putative Aspartic-type endopeptidase [Taphrina deformans PYCC 5710]
MHIAFAAGLLGVAQAVALPAASGASASSTLAANHVRPVYTPVAASDTNRTVVDLGISPAVRRVEVKPNPNFSPNVTNIVAAAQAKFAIIEQEIQLEKRMALEADLEKRALSSSSAKASSTSASPTTTTSSIKSSSTVTAISTSAINAPGVRPVYVAPPKSTSTSTSSAIKSSSTSNKATILSSQITTSSKSSTSPYSSSSTTSSTSAMATTSKVASTSSAIPTSKITSTTTSMSTSKSATSTSSPSSSSTSKVSTSMSTATKSSATTSVSSLPTLKLAAQNIALDSEFLSAIQIGSNGETLDVVMDTGSSDLWMFSSDCVGCTGTHDYYHPSTSKTFVNTTTPFSIGYGDGSSTSGILGFDTVTVAGVPVQAQSIDVAHTISTDLLSNVMDGILGLGFPSLMSRNDQAGITTPVTNMFKQNLIPAAKFGLQFIKSNHWSYNGGGGAWTFGGIDTSVIRGALNTVKLIAAKWWMIPMDSVSIGSVFSSTAQPSVIVDSGTTLILLNPQLVAQIHAYLPGGRVPKSGTHYQIFCNASSAAYAGTRNAYFKLNGVQYGVSAADLAWFPETADDGSQEYCYSGIQPWGGSFGILGVMFLKNVYAVFDQTNELMQFAKRTDVADLTD